MKNHRIKIAFLIIFPCALYSAIYWSGSSSNEFKYIENKIRLNLEVQRQAGNIYSVELKPFGRYKNKYHMDSVKGEYRDVEMEINVAGSKGDKVVEIQMMCANDLCKINKALIDGQVIDTMR